MKKSLLSGVAAALMGVLPLVHGGCGGTTTGNPVITIESGPYSASASSWFELIPSAYAAVSSASLCFKRLRFKVDSSGTGGGSGDIDFSPGEVTLSPSGNSLGQVTVPAGTYRRVEFDLEPGCPGSTSGKSAQVTNSTSTFTSTETVTIKFEGSFTASENGQVLTLGFQNIISQLNLVTSNDDIKDRLEDASVKGSF